MTEKEMLEQLLAGMAAMQKDMAAIKEDTSEIRKQVNVLYEWTDSIELRVRSLEDR